MDIDKDETFTSTLLSATAPQCQCEKEVGKNLVVCIDGTSNQFGEQNTNVIEIYGLLEKDNKQITFYNSGIGTYARPAYKSFAYYRHKVGQVMELAIAWNFVDTIILAYKWLSENYCPNDRIFLFGFSRGAYQVRCLSAMIKHVGLIHRGNEAQIPFAYELYSTIGKHENSKEIAERFRNEFSRIAHVHFVGAWDTVSSIGLSRRKVEPDTTTGMKHVCFFRHALALDEKRVKFLPEFANGGKELQEDHDKNVARGDPPHTKEVWFPGTHSDIGGWRTIEQDIKHTAGPMRWMSYEATALGLRTMSIAKKKELDAGLTAGANRNPEPAEGQHLKDEKKRPLDQKGHNTREPQEPEDVTVTESLTGLWWILEYLPVKHVSYDWQKLIRWPHLGRARYILSGQKVHSSIKSATTFHGGHITYKITTSLERLKGQVRTEMQRIWEHPHQLADSPLPDWVEPDLDSLASQLVTMLWDPNQQNNGERGLENRFRTLYFSPDGPRAVLEHILNSSPKSLATITTADTHNELVLFALRSFMSGFQDPEHTATWQELHRTQRLEVYALAKKLLSEGNQDDYTTSMKFLRSPLGLGHEQHGQGVGRLCVAVSPHGNYFVIGSDDRRLHIFDTVANKDESVRPPKKHGGDVTAVSFSPDERFVASGSTDQTVRIWDTLNNKHVFGPMKGHTGMVAAIAFSPDGSSIASGSYDTTIRFWNVSTGKEEREPLCHHKHPVLSVAFSSGEADSMLASGSSNGTICLWAIQTGNTIFHPFKGHTDGVVSLSFSPDDTYIVSGSRDKTVRLWNTESGKAIGKPLEGHKATVSAVDVSPDGSKILSCSYDHTVRVWDFKGKVTIMCLDQGHGDWVGAAVFLPGGNHIVSASLDGTYISRDAQTGDVGAQPFLGHSGAVLSVRFSAKGDRIISGSKDGTFYIWDTATGKGLFQTKRHKGDVSCVGFSSDDTWVLSAGSDRTIHLWNVTSDKFTYRQLLRGHTGSVLAAAFSRKKNIIVSGSADGTIRIWRLSTEPPSCVGILADAGRVISIDISSDGNYIVSVSADSRIRLWETPESREALAKLFKRGGGQICSVKLSPDGQHVVSGGSDGMIHIWDVRSGKLDGEPLQGHTGSILSVCCSPTDSNIIASCSEDRTIIIWNIAERRQEHQLRGHTDVVHSVAFSPNGELIVSASADSTIRLWNAQTGHPITFSSVAPS